MLTDSVGQKFRNATVGMIFICYMKNSKSCSVVSPQVCALEKLAFLKTVAVVV